MAIANLGRVERIAFTIDAGQSLSASIPIGGGTIVGIDIPAPNAWTNGNLTFQGATDTGQLTPVFNNLYDAAAVEVTITVGAIASTGRVITFGSAKYIDGLRYLKVRSGTSAVPVVQTNQQTLYLLVYIN